MNRSSTVHIRRQSLAIATCFSVICILATTSPAGATGLTLVPVSASGSHAIVGQTIYLDGAGQRVFFEIRLSGWDADHNGDPKLGLYQYQIDSAGFTSGATGSLTLPFIQIPCSAAADCPGYNSNCLAGVCEDNGAFVINKFHPDYVFQGSGMINAVNVINPSPIAGATVLDAADAVADNGTARYAGTMVLDVSANASGTFTVGFVTAADWTFWATGNSVFIPIPAYNAAIIEINPPCDGNNPGLPDCNNNGTIDSCDIWSGTSLDCGGNGVPDECDPDCNANGQPDDCDIAGGISADCDGNGVPDECDLGGSGADCNANGILDGCDIANGTSSDCNANGRPDECDLAAGTSDDCNANGTPDECDGGDCNANGQLDACDLADGSSIDANGNGIPDECDNVQGFALVPVSATGSHSIVGQTIRVEPGAHRITFEIRVGGWDPDYDGDPKLAGYQAQIDSSGFTSGASGALTLPFIQIPCTTNADCSGHNNDCVAGVCSSNGAFFVNESHANYIFLGSGTISAVNVINPSPIVGSIVLNDVDAVADIGAARYAGTVVLDLSEDSTGTFTVGFVPDIHYTFLVGEARLAFAAPLLQPATIEVAPPCSGDASGLPDCNGNGTKDFCDILLGTSSDCNANDVPDECDADCNGNGEADECDIADGTSADANHTGVPDECESFYGDGIALVPVSASGAHTIDGQTIHLEEGNQSVTFEIRVSGWDVNRDGTPRLLTYQAQIDSAGFTNAYGGSLVLASIGLPCSSDADCPGYNNDCIQGVCSGSGAFFVDETHPDYVFSGLDTITAVNVVEENPILGATLWSTSDCVAETPRSRYAGTLVLEVSADAAGDFTVGFVPDGSWYDGCASEHLPVAALLPATVNVMVDCNDNGVLDLIDIAEGSSLDQDGNGVPDECDIMPRATAEGSRFLRTILAEAMGQEAQIIVRCAGGVERYVDYPRGDAMNTALLTEDEASAPYLTPTEWKSPLHVTGISVEPGRTYSVCVELADGTRSMPVTVTTARWGDIIGNGVSTPPDGVVDFRDVAAVVMCFVSDINAPPKARCDLEPELANGVIDFRDIAKAVGAFVDGTYPYATVPDCVEP